MIKILIADDHPIVAKGLKSLLDEQEDMQVLAIANNGKQALEKLAEAPADVALLDLNMPEMNGIDTCKAIKEAHPDTQVVVLTSHHQDAMVYPAIKAGALSYILKSSSYDAVIEAVRAAAEGEARLHPLVAKKLMDDVAGKRARFDVLTARELEVLGEIAKGRDNRSIAENLQLSEQTVKVHVRNVLAKLYVEDRTQAAIYALKEGLVPLDD